MSKIKVLDCTLRDGGYVNQWNFGIRNIRKIFDNLIKSHVEYIECGFLKNIEYNENETLFPTISYLLKLLTEQCSETLYTLMINFGEKQVEE